MVLSGESLTASLMGVAGTISYDVGETGDTLTLHFAVKNIGTVCLASILLRSCFV